jgi:tripartite-type tricarboxylate transporter receptor subunit TctC
MKMSQRLLRYLPRNFGAALGVGLVASLLSYGAGAQEVPYPVKPIRIIVGYSAGGGNDIIARVVATKMAESLGQPVVIENKPGAQSIIAAEYVAKSAPDGYTILMGPSGPMTMNPATYDKLPYSPTRDFVPIGMICSFPLILGVSSNSPFKTVKDLIQFAKANPTKVNYASSAAPFQMASELFNQKSGTTFAHIPYKGSGDSVAAVMSGQITMTISDPAPIVGQIKGGTIRPLAVTSAQRHPQFPDVPTLMESGLPDLEVGIWTGLVAPAATPMPIVRRLQQELAKAVRSPEIRERFAQMTLDPVGNTSEEFAKIIAADIQRWTAVAKAANIRSNP